MPALIVRVPRDSKVERQLRSAPPAEPIALDVAIAEPSGRLEPPAEGTVLYALPSPEGLVRERDEIHRAIAAAGSVEDPLIILLEAASELRDDELGAAIEAAGRTARPVMLVVLGDG